MSKVANHSDHVAWLESLFQMYPRLCGPAMMESSHGHLFPIGWHSIVEDLLANLQPIASGSQEVLQIKEKIGVLHVNLQVRGGPFTALVGDARSAASRTCGACGKPAPTNQFDVPICSACQTIADNA